jgi:hypothetical protein
MGLRDRLSRFFLMTIWTLRTTCRDTRETREKKEREEEERSHLIFIGITGYYDLDAGSIGWV